MSITEFARDRLGYRAYIKWLSVYSNAIISHCRKVPELRRTQASVRSLDALEAVMLWRPTVRGS